jgi:secreted PhoX family phosphatase
MRFSRRALLRNSSAVALGFAGLRTLSGCATLTPGEAELKEERNRQPFALPPGFSQQVISRFGQMMDDGLRTPGNADGMAAFPGPDGKVILVRNHELEVGNKKQGPFGDENKLLKLIDLKRMYDAGFENKNPSLGGTTTILYNPASRRAELVFMSLAGTTRNCAGGPTPWGTWITCEESVVMPDGETVKEHGYNFEVPTRLSGGPFKPEPIKAMGRFYHEAVAVDPRTGIVYQTEDRPDALIYRYLPNTRDKLLEGGKLQAMRVKGQKRFDTRNWRKQTVAVGQSIEVEWVDMENVEAPDDELRYDGWYGHGCARFARGEGMWHGSDGIYFAATTGGRDQRGQIWRYVPSPAEAQAGEATQPGKLELFVEPNNNNICENCDNITFAPWGDMFVCEDQAGKRNIPEQHILRITPTGQISKFARNVLNNTELAGVCFSPDGSTMFVNLYDPGITVAITGPWRELGAAIA